MDFNGNNLRKYTSTEQDISGSNGMRELDQDLEGAVGHDDKNLIMVPLVTRNST